MRKLAYALIAVLVVLTACSSSNNGASPTATSDTAAPSSSPASPAVPSGSAANASGLDSAAGQFPLTEQKETITILAVQDPLITDLVDNEFTRYYENLTNVHIEWEVVQPNSKAERLNLALASGDYPDVLLNFGVSTSQQMVYGSQGTFLSLNDLIAKYGLETQKIFDTYPEVKQAITAPGGNIYALPTIDRNPHVMMFYKMWMYTPWLEKLGLSVPQTTEEFYRMLKAFKEQDPNGNGIADEIPLTASYAGPGAVPLEEFLMNAFILHRPDYLIFDESGSIDVNFNKPEWKEGLKYLNRLYSEGLIPAETFVQNNQQMKERVENPGDVIVGAVRANTLAQFISLNHERASEYKTVPPLEGPSGYRQFPYDYYNHIGGNFIITDKAGNPDLIYRWIDGLLSPEMTQLANIGLEGVGWEKASPDMKGLSGKPAVWNRLIQGGQQTNAHWGQTIIRHFSREMFEGLAATETQQPYILYNETKNNYEPYKAPIEEMVPVMFFNEAQAFEYADLNKTITDYVKEMLVRFTIGEVSIDEGWDKYLATLDSMNLDRYLQIHNEAYRAQYGS
ncbi:extracellular solute-binding protein [Cohnella cellulosilytica]|uniref:Extracellular solute-binding protein n=1 Tax=Cohnella cellulosilytica TaxID=986710 RepID=A0ABW2FBP1_9BACL